MCLMAGNGYRFFRSDAQEFGGSGVVNMGAQEAQEIPANRCQMSIPLRLAPLSVTVYAPEEMPHKEKKTARSRKVKAQAEAKDKTEAKTKVNTKTAAKTKAEPNTEPKKKSSSGEKNQKIIRILTIIVRQNIFSFPNPFIFIDESRFFVYNS